MAHQETNAEGMALGSKQIRIFVAGLYRLAACDGISDLELGIVRQFAEDAGAGHLLDEPESLHFDPVEAYQVLETSWLRRLFLRAALLVIRADGRITSDEAETIGWIASAFGIEGGYNALAAEVEGESL